MTHHITVGEDQRVISCPKQLVPETVCQFFQLHLNHNEELHFKIWNDRWNDWVNIKAEDIPEEGKLKVSIRSVECSPLTNFRNLIDIEQPYIVSPTSSSGNQAVMFELNSANNESHPGVCELDIGEGRKLDVTESQSIQTVEHREERPEWPYPFLIPAMPISIESKTTALNHKDVKTVVEYMYQAMRIYKTYPTAHQYYEAAKALLQKYPQWVFECPGKSPVDFWKQKFMDKYRNERKRHFPEQSFSPKKCRRSITVVQNIIPEGEDLESLSHHKEWMKKEYGKKVYDIKRIENLMYLTAPLRNFINKPLGAAFEEFPFLQSADQLIKEVLRVKRIDMMNVLLRNVEKVPPQLAKIDKPHTALNIVTNVPSFVKERIEDIFLVEQPSEVASPVFIVQRGSIHQPELAFFKVVSENSTVFENTKLVPAVAGFMALHSIFNLKYEKETATIGAFEILFGLPPTVKSHKRALVMLKKCLKG